MPQTSSVMQMSLCLLESSAQGSHQLGTSFRYGGKRESARVTPEGGDWLSQEAHILCCQFRLLCIQLSMYHKILLYTVHLLVLAFFGQTKNEFWFAEMWTGSWCHGTS